MVSFNDRLSITLFISFGHFSDGLLKKEPKVKRDSFKISVLLNTKTMSGYIVMSLRNDGEETTVQRWLKM